MKIALIPHYAAIRPHAHGYLKRIFILAEELAHRGHQVRLFGRRGSIAPRGVELKTGTWPRERNYLNETDFFSWAIRESQDCDIINAQADHLTLPFDRWSTVPILHTVIYGRLDKEVTTFMNRYRSASYMTISRFLTRQYPRLNWQGHVHNGVALNEFRFSARGGKYALYLARISPDKNTHRAIDWAEHYHFPLVLAGPINDKTYFKTMIKPRLSKTITYIGKLDMEKVRYLQRAAFTFCLDEREGFGNSIIESLACGTPVIGFRGGSLPEIIRQGRTGFLIKNDHDLPRALATMKKIKRRDCRDDAGQRFSTTAMVDGYERLYTHFLTSHS